MQFFMVTLTLAAIAAGAVRAVGAVGAVRAREEEIVRDDFDTPTAEGEYKWAMQTEGGIFHEQRGSKIAEELQGADGGAVVQGQYQYTAPDGQVINVVYRADASGFHAEGAHLPTAPPPPPAIARSLAYQARLRGETHGINIRSD